jgi:N-acetylmuramoyl-L-alanine amidase
MALLIPARLKKSRRTINEIIIHCTATPEGRECSVEEIRQWHKARGFADIGYHYVIHLDGRVEPGRNVDIAGAHCTGHNANSIGVVYVGGCAKDGKTPKDTRTEAQKSALANLLINLRKLYPRAKIHGHRDFANKACPSFDATKEYRMF